MQYKDGDVNHNHTYYGNGCPEIFETGGSGGSTTACDSRILYTSDSIPEAQSIGTYYTFQAATAGTGGSSLTTDNTNVPDTFCPLGWQLPYSGTGGDYYDQSRSWKYVFDEYGITSNGVGVEKLRSYPHSYIKTGIYHWTHGKLYSMRDDSLGFMTYWSQTNYDKNSAYRLDHSSPNRERPNKTNGHSIRCAHRFSILS